MALQGGLPKVSLESAGEWLKKSDPKLDQIKEAVSKDLESLKKGQDISAALKETMLKGFKVDLDELGISGKAQDEYVALFENSWKEMETGAQAREILESPELAAMDSFITTLENLPILKEMMESAQPKTKLESWFMGMASAKIPALGKHWETIKTTFLSWIEWDKIKQDPDWAPWLAMIGVETGAVATAAATAAAAKANPAQKEAEKKAPEKVAEKEEKEENETPKAVAESQEAAPKIPKAVTFLGDSNTKAMTDGRFEKFATHEIAEGSQTIDWGLLQMGIDPEAGTLKDEVSETVKKNRQTCLNSEMINIAFGTNDTAKGDSAEDTYGKMQKLVKGLKELNPQLKIALCTVPPLELSEDLETNRNALNKKILEGAGTEYYAIDLSKKLQDPKDPTRLASDVRGDKAHYSKDTAATYLERELIEIYNQSA